MWWAGCGATTRFDEADEETAPDGGPVVDWPTSDDALVGDAEREEAVEALTQHYGAGRLDQVEFERRVLAAFSAVTAGDLRAAQDGLPEVTTRRAAIAAADAERRGALEDLREWAGLAALLVGIWLVTSITAGRPTFFWPIFPLFFTAIGTVPSALRRLGLATRDGLQAARA